MNRLARKLVLSVLSVVLTVVALGTTTFAWFTLTNTSVVQPFNADIVADTGIEIALGMPGVADPTLLQWKTVITTQDIYNFIEAAYPSGFEFTHVSSTNGVLFTDLEGASVTDGFLEIPLHFRSDNETEINWTQVVVSSPTAGWMTGVTFVDSLGNTRVAGSTFNVNAADAVRVSVTGNIGGVNTTTAYENPASEPIRNTVLGANSNADFSNGTVGANGSTNYYYQVNNTLPTGVTSVTTVATVTSISSTKVLDMVTNPVMPEAVYYGVVTVRIWLEGWDAEAYNSLLGRVITASLRFGA
ncbi:MAG: hypothetical protein CVV57_03570 [Tenericutes bacterium HGW-Tenericutes-2]|jgi:hypothetical protein|nr:MAG: hypothetical protein CVV57_03570 [Tenericutes bacterium HGW-Tenericutes-2]